MEKVVGRMPGFAGALVLITVLTLVTACSSGSSGSGSGAETTTAAPTAVASGFQLVTPSAQASAAQEPATGQSAVPRVPTQRATAAAAPASPRATGTTAPTAAGELRYTPIVEPFSPPGVCDENGNTGEITNCVLEQVIDVDSTVDALQLARFEKATEKERAGILKEYARWLSGRTSSCRAKARTGGTIDQITSAECLLSASQDRVETLNDVG